MISASATNKVPHISNSTPSNINPSSIDKRPSDGDAYITSNGVNISIANLDLDTLEKLCKFSGYVSLVSPLNGVYMNRLYGEDIIEYFFESVTSR